MLSFQSYLASHLNAFLISDVLIPRLSIDFESSSDRKHRSSLTCSRSIARAPPPFDLLATLYLDGREKAERRVIVYLDPEYEDFSPGFKGDTARQIMRSRLVRGNDGSIHEHAWIFKDIGIEVRVSQPLTALFYQRFGFRDMP